jgi:ubiquitin C-terminal hydrolase
MNGYINIGNTCYLNAGLQMLMQNEDLCNLLQNKTFSDKSDKLKIISNHITQYKNGATLIPSDIKKLVEDNNEMFKGNKQHDSMEFVIYLLDSIEEEIKKITNNKYPFENILTIEINTRIKCKKLDCLKINNTIEKSNFLLLNINQDSTDLDSIYRDFKSSEKLDQDNMYFCNNCNKKIIASKRQEITTWSDNLLIWIKRFERIGSKLIKNNKSISIPFEWRHNYKLMGAIIHSGNLHGGHYVYIGCKNNKWYLYNDNSVSEIKDVNFYLSTAYCLYYKMQNIIL